MRKWHVAGVYAGLLCASHLASARFPQPHVAEDVRFISVPVIDHGIIGPLTVRLAYRDTDPLSKDVPVVLIHGSPGSSEVLRKLTNLLSPRFRVLVPDLPGFGASTHGIPDYSFRAHAQQMLELLDSLHVPKAQLVGFSMGGGVVLSAVDLASPRVASVVMLSAIGIQEHELTGNYEVNHLLHGAQLGAMWTFRGWFPHFGIH